MQVRFCSWMTGGNSWQQLYPSLVRLAMLEISPAAQELFVLVLVREYKFEDLGIMGGVSAKHLFENAFLWFCEWSIDVKGILYHANTREICLFGMDYWPSPHFSSWGHERTNEWMNEWQEKLTAPIYSIRSLIHIVRLHVLPSLHSNPDSKHLVSKSRRKSLPET